MLLFNCIRSRTILRTSFIIVIYLQVPAGANKLKESESANLKADEPFKRFKRLSSELLRCPQPNGIFPYEPDCAKYLNCAHGRPYLQSCGPGTVFNPKISVCDWPYNVDCGKQISTSHSGPHYNNNDSKNKHGQTIITKATNTEEKFNPHYGTRNQPFGKPPISQEVDLGQGEEWPPYSSGGSKQVGQNNIPQEFDYEGLSSPSYGNENRNIGQSNIGQSNIGQEPDYEDEGPPSYGTVGNQFEQSHEQKEFEHEGKGWPQFEQKGQQQPDKGNPLFTYDDTRKPKSQTIDKDMRQLGSNIEPFPYDEATRPPQIKNKIPTVKPGSSLNTIKQRYPNTVKPGYPNTVKPWYPTIKPRYPSTEKPWNPTTVKPRYPSTEKLWYPKTVKPVYPPYKSVTTKPLSLWTKIKQRVSTYKTTIKEAFGVTKAVVVKKTSETATGAVEKVNKTVKKIDESVTGTKNYLYSDQPQSLCMKPDGLFPYPKNCAKYVNCWRGRGTLQNCALGTLFDASLGVCNWPNKVICSSQPADVLTPEVTESRQEVPTPFSGQLLRLRNGGVPYNGYLEVWSNNNGWLPVVVDGDQWAGKDGVCRTLGFNRGAHSESRGYVYGGKEKLAKIQQVALCDTNTVNPTDCPIKMLKKEDIVLAAVGVRCRRNSASECPIGWHRWGMKCYLAITSQLANHAIAKENCEAEGARLLSITSQEENNFVSDLLSASPNPDTGFHTGGVSLYAHGANYWIWENTKITPTTQLSFSNWWLGWETSPLKLLSNIPNPESSDDSASEPVCISLNRKFPLSEGASNKEYSSQYFFWKLGDCTELHNYVCEQEPINIGCIVDRGESYNGTANVTASGAPCLQWSKMVGAYRGFSKVRQLRENFCLNPDGDDLPWCFVEGGTTEFCDIPRCQTTETLQTDNSTPSVCGSGTFACSSAECIHLEWVCDGQIDCANGKDEKGCPDYSNMFTKQTGRKLVGSEAEKWIFSPKSTCSSRCIQAKNFVCHSFNYEESTSTCVLNKNNAGSVGGLTKVSNWEYHERIDLAPDCSESFECSDAMCILKEMVCDGRRDCKSGEDENDCLDLDSFQVRLVNGSGPHEGRVEIKVEDEWGQICDDMWGLPDGDVVCRQLGFSKGAKKTFTNSRYGNGGGYFLMDDLNCKGNEESLALCDFAGWNKNDCSKTEAAGVQCYLDTDKCSTLQWQCKNGRCIGFSYYCDQIDDCGDGSDENPELCASPVEVRLAASKNSSNSYFTPKSSERLPSSEIYQGRVEVRYKGLWGTLCDDNVELKEGHVLCRMMGWKGAVEVYKNNTFGSGSGPVWLDGLQCGGKERSIADCKHQQWGRTNCDHSEDLGIACTNKLSSIQDAIGKSSQPETPPGILTPPRREHLSSKCGMRFVEDSPNEILASPRIVSGYFPRPGAQPWMVGIRRRTASGSTHECGASILTEDIVLTAAHCLFKYPTSEYLIRTGDYNNEEKDVFEEEWQVENIIIHPEFDKQVLFNNDVGLLKIKRKKGRGITFNERVQPLCLVKPNWGYTAGLNCTVAGWGTMSSNSGYSRILQSTLLPIISNNVCRADYAYGSTRISKGMFCAGYMEGGIDTCQGDSGGPLVCYIEGMYTAVGITSWGHGCARANKPGVYTKLTQYIDWIYNMVLAIQKPKT